MPTASICPHHQTSCTFSVLVHSTTQDSQRTQQGTTSPGWLWWCPCTDKASIGLRCCCCTTATITTTRARHSQTTLAMAVLTHTHSHTHLHTPLCIPHICALHSQPKMDQRSWFTTWRADQTHQRAENIPQTKAGNWAKGDGDVKANTQPSQPYVSQFQGKQMHQSQTPFTLSLPRRTVKPHGIHIRDKPLQLLTAQGCQSPLP